MTDAPPTDLRSLQAQLADPFDPKEVKFKPQMVKNNRAMAMAYIDARLIQDRLDAVLGVENWQDAYEFLPDGSVVCRLRLKLGGRWIAKTDVGSPSEQPDSGDRVKAAVSDALKRAAVKFGIGRYLYRLPAQWVDFDPVKKQLTQIPQLPQWAVPRNQRPPATATKPAQQQPPAKSQQQTQQPTGAPAAATATPFELLRAESARVGWAWSDWMQWLNLAHPGKGYGPRTQPADVPAAHMEQMLRHARTLPNKAA